MGGTGLIHCSAAALATRVARLILFLFVLNTFLWRPAQGFEAYDCQHPETSFQAVDIARPGDCPDPEHDYTDGEAIELQILQTSKVIPVKGHQCKLTVTKEVGKCSWDRNLVYGKHTPLWNQVVPLGQQKCEKIMQEKKIRYEGRTLFVSKIGTPAEGQWYSHGNVAKDGTCSWAEEVVSEGVTYPWSYQHVIAKLQTDHVTGEYDMTDGLITFPRLNNIRGNYQLGELNDHSAGTVYWNNNKHDCGDGISEIYHGTVHVYKKKMNQGAMLDAILMVNSTDTQQYAGLVIKGDRFLCGMKCFETHIPGITVCPPGRSGVQVKFRPGFKAEDRQIQSQIGFMHLNINLQVFDSFQELQRALCAVDRKTLSNKIAAIATDSSPYSLLDVYGPGHMSLLAGGVAYIAKCVSAEVTLSSHHNCTQEVPVLYKEKKFFMNPLTRIIQQYPTVIPCSDLMPVRWELEDGEWYCARPAITRCDGVKTLEPLAPQKMEIDFTTGMGRGIYTEEQLTQQHRYEVQMMSRAPVLADISNNAIENSKDGQLGSPLSADSVSDLTDLMTPSLVPFVWLFGTAWHYISGLGLLYLIVKGLIEYLDRVRVSIRVKGCGWHVVWVLFDCGFRTAMFPASLMEGIFAKVWGTEEEVERAVNRWPKDMFRHIGRGNAGNDERTLPRPPLPRSSSMPPPPTAPFPPPGEDGGRGDDGAFEGSKMMDSEDQQGAPAQDVGEPHNPLVRYSDLRDRLRAVEEEIRARLTRNTRSRQQLAQYEQYAMVHQADVHQDAAAGGHDVAGIRDREGDAGNQGGPPDPRPQ